MKNHFQCNKDIWFDTVLEQGHTTIQQDHLKLEEACVMVDGDEIQLPPKASGNLNTNKVHTLSSPLLFI